MLNTALMQIKARQQRDEAVLFERRQQLYQDIHELKSIDSALARTVARLFPLSGQIAETETLRQEYFLLKDKRRTLLHQHGYAEDVLDTVIYCAECQDDGYVNGKPCRCLVALSAQLEKERLSTMLDLHGQTFETFRLDLYNDARDSDGQIPRKLAEANLAYCRDYAESFSLKSGNILMTGAPGLGKTFLSAAIGGVVTSKGFSVVYDTAVSIIAMMEREKFNNQDTAQGSAKYLGCDLLILDDLGTEMNTAFSQSALYTLINSRLYKPTVINTNLKPEELAARYPASLVSRLRGLYSSLAFCGEDIRGRT